MDNRRQACKNMIERQLRPNCRLSPVILSVVETIPRHLFVPEALADIAYSDAPIPLREGCTLLPPLSYARLLEQVSPDFSHTALEIGGGCGYLSAVLSRLFRKVITLETSKNATARAQEVYTKLSLRNIESLSWEEYTKLPATEGHTGVYDCIIITGALPCPPQSLLPLLKEGGRVIFPLSLSPAQCRVMTGHKSGIPVTYHGAAEHFYPPLPETLHKMCYSL